MNIYCDWGGYLKVAVIDGQGGGIGKALVEKLSKERSESIEIIALGTNSTATTGMIKAGAHYGATGENSIKVMSNKVDIIVGGIAIIIADSLMGEITKDIATSVSTSSAVKLLLPLNRCNIFIAGTISSNLNDLIDNAVDEILKLANAKKA